MLSKCIEFDPSNVECVHVGSELLFFIAMTMKYDRDCFDYVFIRYVLYICYLLFQFSARQSAEKDKRKKPTAPVSLRNRWRRQS